MNRIRHRRKLIVSHLSKGYYSVWAYRKKNNGYWIPISPIYVFYNGNVQAPNAREVLEIWKLFELDPKIFDGYTCVEVTINE